MSSKKGKLWGDPQQLQIDIDSGITIGHPSVLESEDNFVLVFSANMSGGYGGNDLWISTKEKRNAWSSPVNLGPAVNTPGDEQFPFLHESGDLYFASNGHAGMGGLDIFVANKDENDILLKKISVRVAQEFLSMTYKKTEKGAELYLRTLKAAFNRAVDWDIFKKIPLKKLSFLNLKNLIRFL